MCRINSNFSAFGIILTFFALIIQIQVYGQAEINVRVGATSIVNFTGYNVGSTSVGTPVFTTFIIENLGTANLILSGSPNKVGYSGIGPFVINQSSVTSPITAGGTTSFTVSFDPGTSGNWNQADTLRIANNDSNEPMYTILLSGSATASSPEIDILGGSSSIPSGGSYNFGSAFVDSAGAPISFSLQNIGPGNLSFSGSPIITNSNPLEFILDQSSVTGVIPGDNSVPFTISFMPSATGLRQSIITISSNDSDEGTYTINLSGTGITPTPPLTAMHIVGNEFVFPKTVESYKVEVPPSWTYTYTWTYTGTNYFFFPGSTGPNVGIFYTDSATSGKLRCTAYNGAAVFDYVEIDVAINNTPSNAFLLADLVCDVQITNCAVGYIDNFNFNSINTISSGCSSSGYTDYTRSNFSDTLPAGGVYSANLFIPIANVSDINYAGIWLDYNNDGDFVDADEFIAQSSGSTPDIKITNILFKNKEGYGGPKRLRVRSRPNIPFTAAESCALAGEAGETEDYLLILDAQPVLEAPQIITPNEDGKNDYFVIRGIKAGKDNKLTVFDRAGAVKFTSDAYENNWNGSSSNGEKLSPGTYYFVFTNDSNSIKGFLEIRY